MVAPYYAEERWTLAKEGRQALGRLPLPQEGLIAGAPGTVVGFSAQSAVDKKRGEKALS
jgi:hypothetical protein